MLILQKKEDNVSKIEQLFVKKVAKYKEKEEIKDLPKLQKQILQNAAKYVKVGGTLIYSTCTVQDDENIEVVENFLQSNKRFQFEKIENINIDLENEDKGYLKIYPNIHGMDGFFIAKLKRVRQVASWKIKKQL